MCVWGGVGGGRGGGGRGVEGEVQKRYLHKGKLNEKNHARQLTLKNVHAIA